MGQRATRPQASRLDAARPHGHRPAHGSCLACTALRLSPFPLESSQLPSRSEQRLWRRNSSLLASSRLPVLSVVLVAFAGGLTDRARQVVQTAVSIQAVALGLGVISWLGAFGAHVRPGIWFIAEARFLAIAAVALIFTAVVLRSRALRAPTPQFQDFDEGRGLRGLRGRRLGLP
jgi:type IV secretory pathway TrbD component